MLAPLLAATGAAYGFTVLALRRSMLTEKIARRGQHITREYAVDPFELTRAADIMASSVQTLPAVMRVCDAVDFFAQREHEHRSYPVVDKAGRPVGIVSRSDALRWRMEGGAQIETLQEAVSDPSMPMAHPDWTVARVADLMIEADVGRVPIVDPASGKLVGLVARKDLLRLRAASGALERERQAFVGPAAAGAT
jgi:CBS domain-containing protein